MYPGRQIASHWLYRIIPFGRENARGWRVPLWALFGNDDDGIFGEGARVWWPEVAKERATWWIALRWWLRNPFHNLFTRTFAWKRETVRVLYLRIWSPQHPASAWWVEWPQNPDFWSTFPQETMLRIHALPPLIMWRGKRTEGYAGWKSAGHFGLAFRGANSPMM